MPLSIRQQIWNAVKVRFGDIRVVNGYATNIGARVFSWRDLTNMPFWNAEFDMPTGPVMDIRDPRTVLDNDFTVLGKHARVMTVEVRAAATGDSPDNLARSILADIDKAIGVDRKWAVGGVDLAIDTIPVSEVIEVVHEAKRLAATLCTFTIIYRHQRFDHYTQ